MRIAVIGEGETAKATRMLVRQAGFALADAARADYRVFVEEWDGDERIHLDSVDSPLEAAILKHITQHSRLPVVVDRPGGLVHCDREIRIGVSGEHFEQQHAVELGVLRGLLELSGHREKTPRWKRIFSAVLLAAIGAGILPIKSLPADQSAMQISAPPGISRPNREEAPPELILPAAWKEKIRDLQYRQDKLLLRLKDLQIEQEQVKQQVIALRDEIQDAAYQAAQEKQVNVRDYVLDLDLLVWQPKGKRP